MTIEESLKACEDMVRRADPDRFLSALFVPVERRPLIFALYAFNHELARVAETVREPMMGEIRLEWWREVVSEAYEGRPRAHDVARALAELFARSGPPVDLFETMIDARSFDVTADMFQDARAFVSYADATSGSVMRIAAQILSDGGKEDAMAHDAGIAFGISGILRALPHHTARRKVFLPADLLGAEGLSAGDILAGKADRSKIASVVAKLAQIARAHHANAQKSRLEEHTMPAFLPAAIVPLYLKRLTRPGIDPLHDIVEMPAYRKQLSFLRAAMTHRL